MKEKKNDDGYACYVAIHSCTDALGGIQLSLRSTDFVYSGDGCCSSGSGAGGLVKVAARE
jgi:hypothetical protein